MKSQSCIQIKKELDIVGARQLGRDMAKDLGFGTVDQARIATAISELARNIYLYTEQGKICFEVTRNSKNKVGLVIVAEDQGPGISDISEVMQDGFTTSGGLGAGLPGIKRLMDEFELQSEAGEGTTVRTTKWVR